MRFGYFLMILGLFWRIFSIIVMTIGSLFILKILFDLARRRPIRIEWNTKSLPNKEKDQKEKDE